MLGVERGGGSESWGKYKAIRDFSTSLSKWWTAVKKDRLSFPGYTIFGIARVAARLLVDQRMSGINDLFGWVACPFGQYLYRVRALANCRSRFCNGIAAHETCRINACKRKFLHVLKGMWLPLQFVKRSWEAAIKKPSGLFRLPVIAYASFGASGY